MKLKLFTKIYAKRDSELLDLDLEDIIQIHIPKLDTCLSESLDINISVNEIYEVLKNMKKQ